MFRLDIASIHNPHRKNLRPSVRTTQHKPPLVA